MRSRVLLTGLLREHRSSGRRDLPAVGPAEDEQEHERYSNPLITVHVPPHVQDVLPRATAFRRARLCSPRARWCPSLTRQGAGQHDTPRRRSN